jgi:hypothetical protein
MTDFVIGSITIGCLAGLLVAWVLYHKVEIVIVIRKTRRITPHQRSTPNGTT